MADRGERPEPVLRAQMRLHQPVDPIPDAGLLGACDEAGLADDWSRTSSGPEPWRQLDLADVVDAALGAGVVAAGLATTLARPFLAVCGHRAGGGRAARSGAARRPSAGGPRGRGGQVRGALER